MVVYDKMQPKILWQDSGRVRDREGRCFRNCPQKMTGNLEGALNLLVFVSCLAESLRSLHAEWLFCIKSPCVFSGVPVAGSHKSLDPTVSYPLCWSRNTWPNINVSSNSAACFSSQWGLPALSVLEAHSPAGTWQWELVGMLWKALRVSATLLLIQSLLTWKVLLHSRLQSCLKRPSWRWVYPPRDLLGAKDRGE